MPAILHRQSIFILRLVLALVLAFGTGIFLASGDAESRDQAVAEASARADGKIAEVGSFAFGRTFLDGAPQGPNIGQLTNGGLKALDEGIDPARRGGALFPVRKMIEHLVGFLIWPIVLISILHALFTARGASDQALLKVGIQFFTVVVLLWAYPAWDALLYRHIAIPISDAMQKPAIVKSILENIDNLREGGGESLADGIESSAYLTPLEQLYRFNSDPVSCAMQIEVAPSSEDVAQACLSEEQLKVIRAVSVRELDYTFQGTDSAKAVWWSQLPASKQLQFAEEIEHNGRGYGLWGYTYEIGEGFVDSAVSGAKGLLNAVTHPSEWLNTTAVGILMTLQRFLTSVIFWFIWIGIIVARGFSLSLAPLAIVWGLAPGGQTKVKAWFEGHAKICLWPVGLSFGILVFYTIQVSLLTTPILTNAVVSLGLKFALFLMLIAVMFKSGTIAGMISGDVTRVAQDFGSAARNKTIMIAGAAVAGTAAVGGAAATGAAGMAGKAGAGKLASKAMASKPGQVMDRFASTLTANRLPGAGLAERLGLGKKGTQEAEMGGPTKPGMASAAGVAWRAVRDTATVGARAATQSGKAMDTEHTATPKGLRTAFGTPFAEAKSSLEKGGWQGKGDSRATVTGDDAVSSLQRASSERDLREEILRRHRLEKTPLDKAEMKEVLSSIDLKEVALAGRSESEIQKAKILGTVAMENLVAEGVNVNVEVGEDGRLTLSGESLQGIQNRIEVDDQLRSLLEDEAVHVFGSKQQTPMIEGQHGKVIDLSALLQRSSSLQNGIGAAAQIQEVLEQEAFRRQMVAQASGAENGSILEHVARNTDDRLLQWNAEEDPEAFELRAIRDTRTIMRGAWYLKASPAERQSLGLPADGSEAGVRQAFLTAEIDLHTRNWDESGSMPSDPEAQAATRSAIGQAAQVNAADNSKYFSRRVVSNGVQFGLDTDQWRTSRSENYLAEADSVFDQVVANQPALLQDQTKAYETARKEALQIHGASLPKKGATEDDAAYFARIAPQLNEAIFLASGPRS